MPQLESNSNELKATNVIFFIFPFFLNFSAKVTLSLEIRNYLSTKAALEITYCP